MQQRTHLTLSLFLPLLLYTTPSFSFIPSTDSFVYGGCSQLKYGPGSPYQLNINSLLTSLLSSSSFITYNNSTFCGQDSSPLYGLYQCRGDVSTSDCYRFSGRRYRFSGRRGTKGPIGPKGTKETGYQNRITGCWRCFWRCFD